MKTLHTQGGPETERYIRLVRAYHDAAFEATGHVPVAYTRSYGCQQNVSDGEKLQGMLSAMGYTPGEGPQGADLILYNTCAVRENAEDRVFGNVGALKREKQQNPGLIVGLCGCMVQQRHVAEKIRQSFPYVDLVFGTHVLHLFPRLLYQKLTGGGRIFEIPQNTGGIVEDLPVRREGSVKAWLPIMYGCDNYCTYCVVPFVRGRERSREPGRILEEAGELIAGGYKEFTLLGQNVNSYGKTLSSPISFASLLEQLNALPGDFRIRFMTSHPKDCTRELIDTMARCEKICAHLHLPVQSGSDRILQAMNRRYTKERYLNLIEYARQKIPGIAFSSDIIVGFPGETREDFEQTLDLVRRVGYHSLYTFLYSPRIGTAAASLEDPAPGEEKSRWFRELLDTQGEIGTELYRALEGQALRVLAEGRGRLQENHLTGRAENNVIVDFAAPAEAIGEFVKVRITAAHNWAVEGELAELKNNNQEENI